MVRKVTYSFLELSRRKSPKPEMLIATLRDYAEGGWSIDARTVITIIDKTPLTPAERRELISISQTGIEVQGKNRTGTDQQSVLRLQGSYQEVINHLRST